MNRSVCFHAIFSEDSNPNLAFLSSTDDSASLIPPSWHRLLHAHVARCWRNDSIGAQRCHGVLPYSSQQMLNSLSVFHIVSNCRQWRGEGKPETFNFLGFTHICEKKRSNGR